MELKVVAIDNRQEPLELVQNSKYSPDLAINSSKIDAENALQSTTQNTYSGVDATLVLAEPIAAYKFALALTKIWYCRSTTRTNTH
jgi:hypothetical protein